MNFSASLTFEFHGFCDASTRSYAVVVYLKTIHSVTAMVVSAKTRIAPANAIIVPRLETCSILLLSELIQVVQYALPVK